MLPVRGRSVFVGFAAALSRLCADGRETLPLPVHGRAVLAGVAAVLS